MEKFVAICLLPFTIWVLLIAWLAYASSGGRSVKLSIKGLGLSISVDTSPTTKE